MIIIRSNKARQEWNYFRVEGEGPIMTFVRYDNGNSTQWCTSMYPSFKEVRESLRGDETITFDSEEK